MTDNELPRSELSSWKEVAAFLRVSVRTAQKWEREKGLPVHRMPGSAGRVVATTNELARWRERIARSQPWWARARIRVYYAVVLPILLAAVLVHDFWLHHADRARVPSSYRIEWNQLVILDSAGTEMWRKLFPKPIEPLPGLARHAIRPPVEIQDVNQDGVNEVLFIKNAANFGDDALFCYARDGSDLWRFDPPAAHDPGAHLQNTLTNVVFAPDFAAASGYRRDRYALLAITCRLPMHESRVFSLDGKGRAVELLRHEGHLDRLDRGDVDVDGIVELVIGGFDAERHQAKLYLLHPPTSLTQPAEVEAEVLFPGTALNGKRLGENRVFRMTARKGYLQVSTLEWLDEEPHEVCYGINSQLAVQAWRCSPFPLIRHGLIGDGIPPSLPEANPIEELGRLVQVISHRSLTAGMR